MTLPQLPDPDEMYDALVRRDPAYEGIFVAAVTTTGIVCRPTCPARKPRREHVEFHASARDALFAGFRPCRRCRPLEPAGATPDWLRPLVDRVEADPGRRWRDADLRELGLDPGRVRRWFKANHGMTFQAYSRSRRLHGALERLREGDSIDGAAWEHGYESVSGFRDAIVRVAGAPAGRARAAARSGDGGPLVMARLLTPLGPMVAVANDEGVCLLEFADRRMLPVQLGRAVRRFGGTPVPGRHRHLGELGRELEAYFAGERVGFSVPLVLRGTPFQEACWTWLRSIPAGETRTYGQGALAVGRPEAIRAFAHANGDNRLAILVPCHRVVDRDGRLTGYGGGLWRKRALLELEGAAVARGASAVPA